MKKPYRLITFAFAVFLMANPTPVIAADADSPGDAILILDASGSMWGQIDGVNKIVIARDVVEGLVRTLPAQQRLGMVAYGHRREGDCKDIETLAPVGGERSAMIRKIRGLSPKGKTPLSASVMHAATALDYEKNAATVILVSDGLENCDADPCALARTLEENGLNFTVHVVGFDVTEQERKGLQCIAKETGGQFLTADNADQLADALSQVALTELPPEPEGQPASVPVALKATMLENGPDIQSKLSWRVASAADDATVFFENDVAYADTELPPGDYVATATWSGWREGGEKVGSKAFTAVAARASVVTVPVDLGIPVTLESAPTVAEGMPVTVRWSGPDDLRAMLSVNRLDDGPRRSIYFSPAKRARDVYQAAAEKAGDNIDSNQDGVFDEDDMATVEVGGPSVAGEYEVRYVLDDPRLILARNPLTVTDSPIVLTVPAEVPASSKFLIEWSGRSTPGDFVTLSEKDSKRAFTNGVTAKVVAGQPAQLTAFAEPGDYEVRYVLANGYTTYPGMQHAVQASVPISVIDVQASVTGPTTVIGGSTVRFNVQPAPGWEDDYVSVVEVGAAKPNRDSRMALSRSDGPGKYIDIRVPAIAGDYEMAYFLHPGTRVLSRTPLTVEQAAATIDAPDKVKTGVDFQVDYSGAAFRGDRIIICPQDTPDNKMWQWSANYGFISKAGETSGTVRGAFAAKKPGRYEARYVTGLQHVVLARDAFVVED